MKKKNIDVIRVIVCHDNHEANRCVAAKPLSFLLRFFVGFDFKL
jgi:hypothetical protein